MNFKANILVETEGLSKEAWLNYRRMGVGGSDVAALLGISRWKSELDLWLEKTGQTDGLVVENEAMQWGTIMEPVIRNHFAAVTGKTVVEVKAMLQHPQHSYMLANIDGLTEDDNGNPAILEVKTASEYKRSEWENGIPVYYETQIQHYLAVTGVPTAYVAVLIGGNTFKLYEVDADEDVQRNLITLEGQFWIMVQNNIRPDIGGSDAAAEWLNKMYKGGITEPLMLPQEALGLIDEYVAAAADEDSAKARKQAAANHLKEMLGNHEKGQIEGHTVGWKPVTTERLDTTALKAKEPEIVKKYTKATTSRRFTVR